MNWSIIYKDEASPCISPLKMLRLRFPIARHYILLANVAAMQAGKVNLSLIKLSKDGLLALSRAKAGKCLKMGGSRSHQFRITVQPYQRNAVLERKRHCKHIPLKYCITQGLGLTNQASSSFLNIYLHNNLLPFHQ